MNTRVIELGATGPQWKAPRKKPPVTLTFSTTASALTHVHVTLVTQTELLPAHTGDPTDQSGELKQGETLCTGMQDFMNVKPTQLQLSSTSDIILEDLCMCFAAIFHKFTFDLSEFKYDMSTFQRLPRFRNGLNVDTNRGHFGLPALIKVAGKVYPLIFNGTYVLLGTLSDHATISTRVRPDSDRPFFSVLDMEISPEDYGEELKCFDEYFNLTKDQYISLFSDAQVRSGNTAGPSTSLSMSHSSIPTFTPTNRPQRRLPNVVYNDRKIFKGLLPGIDGGKQTGAAKNKNISANRSTQANMPASLTPQQKGDAGPSSPWPLVKRTRDTTETHESSDDDPPILPRRKRAQTVTPGSLSALPTPQSPQVEAIGQSAAPQMPPVQSSNPFESYPKEETFRQIAAKLNECLPAPVPVRDIDLSEEGLAKLKHKSAEISAMHKKFLKSIERELSKPYAAVEEEVRRDKDLADSYRKLRESY